MEYQLRSLSSTKINKNDYITPDLIKRAKEKAAEHFKNNPNNRTYNTIYENTM